MNPAITLRDGRILSASLVARCQHTGEIGHIYLELDGPNALNIHVKPGLFGYYLSPEQACDLGTTLIHWAKTKTLEAEG